MRCLVLGPRGAGKSLLVKKLKALEGSKRGNGDCDGVGVLLPTLPTVGASVEELNLGRRGFCLLKEYGGSMAPIWSSSYSDCDLLVYVIDATDCTQISAATILLLEALGHRDLREKPVLVVFNKLDRHCPLSLAEYKSVMRLEDILRHSPQRVCVAEGSCTVGTSLALRVFDWIKANISGSL